MIEVVPYTSAVTNDIPQVRVSFCPHCGNNTPQTIVYSHETDDMDFEETGQRIPLAPITYFVAICGTCDQLLIYCYDDLHDLDDPDRSVFECAELLWPTHAILPSCVPELVRDCYQEALSVKMRSSMSFATNIRRALEAICENRQATGKDLNAKLQVLSSRGDIPGVLADMTAVVRMLGNIGAHDFRTRLTQSDANTIDEFFKAIVEYVYVAPDRVRGFKTRLAQFGKTIETSSNPQ